jgi:lipopolysaccharide/colanic/teichoic acid biosynthesis glycosyltransferase
MTVTIERRTSPPRPMGHRRARQSGAQLIGQDLFRGVLVRERRRADRSDRPLMLVLVGLSGDLESAPARTWGAVSQALDACKRDTDVMGWFEQDQAIGVMLPEIPATGAAFVHELETRVRRELARTLEPQALQQLSMRLLAHPGPASGEGPAVEGVDPLIAGLGSVEHSRAYYICKRALDVAGSLALLTLFAPVFAVVAALVKLTSAGPVFFRQVRIGQGGKPFTMLKFRSMRVNASVDIHQQYVTQFIKSGAAAHAGVPGVYKLTNDPRITPIGSFIRKTSIDELPQFLNVLGGSMSLVGPRPPLKYEVEQYKPWHCRRVLEAKPGITGLWQVKGRSRTTFDEMVRLDLRYARSRSIWTDLRILLATPRAVIAGKGAC